MTVPVECFIDGDWGLRFRPFTLDGVLVLWPKALRSKLSGTGELDAVRRAAILDVLADTLPPAS